MKTMRADRTDLKGMSLPEVETVLSRWGGGGEREGETVESVLIPEEDRRTLCISSQVGCALRCGFCATGATGFRRNMTSAEIVHPVCFAVKRLTEKGERLT